MAYTFHMSRISSNYEDDPPCWISQYVFKEVFFSFSIPFFFMTAKLL